MKTETETLEIRGLKKEYTFFHVSDAHVFYVSEEDDEEEKRLAEKRRQAWKSHGFSPLEAFFEVLEYVNGASADGLFVTGDCADYVSSSTVSFLRSRFETLSCETFYVFGNHEGARYERTVPDVKAYYPEYAPVMGGDPSFWVRDFGELLVVGIDDSEKRITAEQLRRLKAQLSRGIPILLLMHVPLCTAAIGTPVKEKWGEDGLEYFTLERERADAITKEFFDLVSAEQGNVVAIFAGHIHVAHKGEFARGKMQYTAAPVFERYVRKIKLVPGSDSSRSVKTDI